MLEKCRIRTFRDDIVSHSDVVVIKLRSCKQRLYMLSKLPVSGRAFFSSERLRIE